MAADAPLPVEGPLPAKGPLRVGVVTLFPDMVEGAVRYGITGRALEQQLWRLWCVNPREFATDNYRTIDDRPYGGGPGMVMLAEPLEKALDAAQARIAADGGPAAAKVVYLSPQGRRLDHAGVLALKEEGSLVLLAGRYEGVDERLLARRVGLEVSIGDYVVSGGELPALVLIDALVRHLPGATNDPESVTQESFAAGLLDCPQYTRPENGPAGAVPAVLLSGNHARIRRWRLKQALGRTWMRRPDLLAGRPMSDEESRLLEEFKRDPSSE